MATIVKELWGAHPTFIRQLTRKSIFDLARSAPNGGAGLRIASTEHYRKGMHDSFYTITTVKDQDAYGVLTWKGKQGPAPVRIPKADAGKWHLYEPPHELKTIEEKLRILPDAPARP
ncbi:uncharacterized protein BJ171DRAFT_476379 [Polychytrium aggregatum]|uniref:uncharacterized protein n=1 Tax=Polychytrium aggregatum TaxID=110093 RepID=UPI0022FE1B6B|nr:uncharacterized protein BJ171DRAFT_476379 [Polychytrium aggregatum]KAI9202901.1 hypothetical protein BJ171DRAFT_476379 [Polychytrium aggregatum]